MEEYLRDFPNVSVETVEELERLFGLDIFENPDGILAEASRQGMDPKDLARVLRLQEKAFDEEKKVLFSQRQASPTSQQQGQRPIQAQVTRKAQPAPAVDVMEVEEAEEDNTDTQTPTPAPQARKPQERAQPRRAHTAVVKTDNEDKENDSFFSRTWVKIGLGVICAIAIAIAVWYFWPNGSVPSAARDTPSRSNVASNAVFASDAIKPRIEQAPKTYMEILDNWISWIVVIFLLRLLNTTFASETNKRNEPKDYVAVRTGFIWFMVLYILSAGITPILIQACAFAAQNCVGTDVVFWTTILVRVFAATILLGSGLGAATGGNWDASPISISFFTVGVIFKLTWSGAEFFGNACLLVGFGIHLYEIFRHKDRAAGIFGLIAATIAAVLLGYFVALGVNTFPLVSKYRLVIGFVAAVLAAIGASSSFVREKVGAALPGSFRENMPDPAGTIFFDLKLVVIMAAIAAVIFG